MLPDYEIVPRRGIGIILFGITREELVDILGEPDETELPDESSGVRLESCLYNSINCSFSFDPDHDGKLVEISVENGYFHVFNLIRVGVSKEDLLAIETKIKLGKAFIKDEGSEEFPTHELISYDHLGLNLHFDDGIISKIQIRVLFNTDDSVNWPEENNEES